MTSSSWHLKICWAQAEADVQDKKEELAQSLFDHIPVGVGSQGIIPTTAADLEASLEMGMDWSLREVSPHAVCALRRQENMVLAHTLMDTRSHMRT